jgi:LiaF transmembrane domain
MEENVKPKQDYPPKITGGLILILLGVLFLMSEMDKVSWSDWWAYFLVGLGAIFLIEALLRSFSPEGRKAIGGRLVAGPILVVIGGSHLIGFEEWWPLILIVVGVGVLISAVIRK